jgi:hypothetical protein
MIARGKSRLCRDVRPWITFPKEATRFFNLLPGATRFALAPGYHIPRLRRYLPRVAAESIVCREVKLMKRSLTLFSIMVALFFAAGSAVAQDGAAILTGADLTRVVPNSFYFQGLSAPTQMRNTAAARFGKDRYVISGLVDTSGYSADVRAIKLNGESLPAGAYGFGFANEGKLTVMDLGGKDLLSVPVTNDKDLRRPRPLMMAADPGGVRLYNGKDYVVIAAQ